MAQDRLTPLDQAGPSSQTWWYVLAALALTLPAWLITASEAPVSTVFPFLLAVAGTLFVGRGVLLRLRQTGWDWPDRLETAAFISTCGLVALLCYQAMGPELDSGRLFYGAAFLITLVGAVLILLPSLYRRIAISLLVLFHFGGMCTAITSVDPPGHVGPWVSKQLWTWVYRPYLSFLYLSNAYHFYSPEPGPPTLFWFAVKYSDGSYSWVKLPDRANSPHGMHYNRLLALPQHTFIASPRLPLTEPELQLLPPGIPRPERGSWETIYKHRLHSGTQFRRFRDPANGRVVPIPMVWEQDVAINLQYSEPTEASRRLIASVAVRVLTAKAPPAPREDVHPVSVKVYRVVHQVITPYEVASGVSPFAKHKHWPYFLGEFDRDGRLLDPKDPFLYWYLPIAYVPPEYPEHGLNMLQGVATIRVSNLVPKDGHLLDCVEMHAAGWVQFNPEGVEEK